MYQIIYSGEISSGLSVNLNEQLTVANGGIAVNTTVNDGYVTVSSGGILRNTKVTSNGYVQLIDGGTVENINLDSNSILWGHGGTINSAAVVAGGSITMGGGVHNNLVASSGGNVLITSEGVCNSAAVFSSGYMALASSAHCDQLKISGGSVSGLSASFGSTTLHNGAYLDIYYGNAGHTVINSGGSMVISDANAGHITLNKGGELSVYGSSVVSNLQWTPFNGGKLLMGAGAKIFCEKSVSGVYFGSGEVLHSSALKMTDVVVNDTMYVMRGGTAEKCTVTMNGKMIVHEGATVNDVTLTAEKDGWKSTEILKVYGGVVNRMIITDWVLANLGGNGVFNDLYIKNGADVYAGGNCVLNRTKIGEDGILEFYGKAANNTIVEEEGEFLAACYNDGIVDSTIIKRDAVMYALNGLVLNTTINPHGRMIVTGGQVENTTVAREGDIHVVYGIIKNTTVNSDATVYVSSGGSAYQTAVAPDARMVVSSGGKAALTSIENLADMHVFDSAYGIDTTVKSGGELHISSTGTASNTVVKSGGSMILSSGGILKGTLQLENGAVVSAFGAGNKFDFSVTNRLPADGYLVNNFAPIAAHVTCTITAAPNLTDGVYKLAQHAEKISGNMTIGNSMEKFGGITVNGDAVSYNNISYKLTVNNGDLTLTVKNNQSNAGKANCDIDGNGFSDTILYHSTQGFCGSWLTTGENDIIKWGALSDVNNSAQLLGTGQIAGTGTECDDIFLTNGGHIGAWIVDGGVVTGYKSIADVDILKTEILGLGDFDGDNATDILLRSTAGDVGCFLTDGSGWNYFQSLGSEWTIAASGDLNGDGIDDIILRHDAGFAGTWLVQQDGTLQWANLDTLESDFDIVGTGDFNGDGIDDVLLQKDYWCGAWIIENGSVKNFMGIGEIYGQIEQIGDYNSDGIDDLRVNTAGNDIGAVLLYGADKTEWKYFGSLGSEWRTNFTVNNHDVVM